MKEIDNVSTDKSISSVKMILKPRETILAKKKISFKKILSLMIAAVLMNMIIQK